MVDVIVREKYSPVAKFDREGKLHRLDSDWSDGSRNEVSVRKVVEVNRAYAAECRCEKVRACGEDDSAKTDPVKGGVADIPASLGGWGGSVGNLLDVFA